MIKKKNYVYLFLIFVLSISVASYVFLDVKSSDSAQRKISLENIRPEQNEIDIEIIENANIADREADLDIIEAIEDDLEEITINDEDESVEKQDDSEEESVSDKMETKNPYSILPAYDPIKRSSNEIKIGFITDTHVTSYIKADGTRSLKEVFIDRINYFVEKMNNEVVPDFMLINGDVIEGTRTPADIGIKELQLTKALFDRSKIQKYWVLGNHDLRSVTKQQWKNALGINYLQKAFEVRDYKIIILDSNFTKDDKDVVSGSGYTRGRVSAKEIEWLKKELGNTKKKAIVFIHHPPLWNVDIKSNDGLPDNSKELRSIFSQYGVLAVFAGHIEDFYYEKVEGVNYFVTPGIYKHSKYKGTSSVISIKDDKITLEASYLKDETEYRTIRLKSN